VYKRRDLESGGYTTESRGTWPGAGGKESRYLSCIGEVL